MSMPTTNQIDSVMNEEESERSQSRNTVSKAEDVKNNQQEAVSIIECPTAQNLPNKPGPEIGDETLNAHPLNAEITDHIAKPMSPGAEIIENAEELDTSQISEKSASILPANADAQNDEDKTILMKKDDVKDQSEVGATISVPDNIKPLVDYDDTFTDVTQPTVQDSENEDSHEESESDLTQEFVSLSEIPTSQLDTSIPSEFESDPDKEQPAEQSEKNKVKANVGCVKKKKK